MQRIYHLLGLVGASGPFIPSASTEMRRPSSLAGPSVPSFKSFKPEEDILKTPPDSDFGVITGLSSPLGISSSGIANVPEAGAIYGPFDFSVASPSATPSNPQLEFWQAGQPSMSSLLSPLSTGLYDGNYGAPLQCPQSPDHSFDYSSFDWGLITRNSCTIPSSRLMI